jgi:hypothetical protein
MADTQNTLYLVFLNVMPGKEAEFTAWYAEHVAQVLEIEGFESARRMAQTEIAGRPNPEFAYLGAYEIAGDPNAAFARMKEAREAGKLTPPDPTVVQFPFKGMVYSTIE